MEFRDLAAASFSPSGGRGRTREAALKLIAYAVLDLVVELKFVHAFQDDDYPVGRGPKLSIGADDEGHLRR